jgi:3-deoxy-manno-octulosonate cytidylyltransferase (CMP-KDO synthetase)
MALRTLGVIPARLASTRLPRKLLRKIAGKPLLAWVVEAARACPHLDHLLVAADSAEIAALCRTLDVRCVLTSPALPSGTDRLHAVAQLPPWDNFDLYVNIQGDEPFLRPSHIASLLGPFQRTHTPRTIDITTLKVRCTPENIANPNAVKVVTAADGRALYFSRATIPYDRDSTTSGAPQPALSLSKGLASEMWESSHHRPGAPSMTASSSWVGRNTPEATAYWKHIGLYAYRRSALNLFPTLPPSLLERTERLEQLRFLENNISIYVEPTEHDTIGVDTESDLLLAQSILLAQP